MKKKALLIDAHPVVKHGETYIKLYLKGKSGGIFSLYYPFNPFFYFEYSPEAEEAVKNFSIVKRNEIVKAVKVEKSKKLFGFDEKELLKVYVRKNSDINTFIKELPFPSFETDIPLRMRFFVETGVFPFSTIYYEREGKIIKKIYKARDEFFKLNYAAFDIEVYAPLGKLSSDYPVISISVKTKDDEVVFTWKENAFDKAKTFKNEREMLKAFKDYIKEKKIELLFGFNTTGFDLPFLAERFRKNGLEFFSMQKIRARKGMVYFLESPIHVDLYPLMQFFDFIGVIDVEDYSLDTVAKEIVGEGKKEMDRNEMYLLWDKNKVDKILEYNLFDSVLTFRIAKHFLPLIIGLSKLTNVSIAEIPFSSSSVFVEGLLFKMAKKRGMLVKKKPSFFEVQERREETIEGAFVKLPEPGIYENIAVVDFRSMYPSIIISYNIDPFTITEKDGIETGVGINFRSDVKGLIPYTVEKLVDERIKLKRKLKEMREETDEYKILYARSWSLKILANSFYGYLGYANSRYYSKRCAEAITALGRKYIKFAEEEAEKFGFEVIYIDTDSLFLLMKEKSKEDVFKFLESFNKKLPEKMELELEAFYVRGVFVSKKGEEKGAKKKYALLREDGHIKIRGFELVRRDWSFIARETQEKVLNIILREGDKEKAISYVKEIIEKIRKKELPVEKFVIYTQLKKEPEEYEVKSPEVVAALKARRRGIAIGKGSVVGYVISKAGKSISDRAEYYLFAKDYDAEYYIKHQILPAVMKILKELGVREEDLLYKGKQTSLLDW